jgi:hypothetical protein
MFGPDADESRGSDLSVVTPAGLARIDEVNGRPHKTLDRARSVDLLMNELKQFRLEAEVQPQNMPVGSESTSARSSATPDVAGSGSYA